MGNGKAGQAKPTTDERWFAEWFEQGYQALLTYLARRAAFTAWCVEHDRKELA